MKFICVSGGLREMAILFLKVVVLVAASTALVSCGSTSHVIVSVADQKMALFHKDELVKTYAVSTSKFGLGDQRGSGRTPLGTMRVAKKIGAGAPVGTVFKSRERTGEIIAVNAPGRDPIVTRILWLRGTESINRNTFARYIYIHGTPDERNIGRRVSYGCIRMKSDEIIDLYRRLDVGSNVLVVKHPLERYMPEESEQKVPQS